MKKSLLLATLLAAAALVACGKKEAPAAAPAAPAEVASALNAARVKASKLMLRITHSVNPNDESCAKMPT